MLKNKIFYSIVIIFVFLIFVSSVKDTQSQSPTPILPIKIDCGYADQPDMSKCCETKIIDREKLSEASKNFPIGGSIIDILSQINIEEKVPYLRDIIKKCYIGEPDESSGVCICKQANEPTPVKKLEEICERYIINLEERSHCLTCTGSGGMFTAFGCIPLNIGNFITDFLLKRLIGLAGIIALICIIYSAFQIQTSQGNPEKVKKSQELLTSCIMGLMLIIFAVFILRLVGVNILRIPGLE